MIVRTRITDDWNDIPDVWKKTKNVSEVRYATSPTNAGLATIFEPFISDDDLRPAMTGIYFDKENVVATDAHRLLIVPNKGSFKGIYQPESEKLIDSKFPDYRVVIPESADGIYMIEIDKLRCYLTAAINGQYSNQSTSQINLFYENDFIAVSSKFFLETLNAFKMLGYDFVYAGIAKGSKMRAILFCAEKEYLKNTKNSYGKTPLALLMPLFANTDYEGKIPVAFDVDFARELNVKYRLDTNEIINSDGTVVNDWKPKTEGVPYMKEEELKLIKKIVNSGSSKILPILEHVKVLDKVATCTNLETFYQIKGVDVQDGLFALVNGALVNQDDIFKIDDYPLLPQDEFTSVGKFGMIEEIKQASDYVGNDSLREVMMGVHIYSQEYNGRMRMRVEATNAHMIYSIMKEVQDSSAFDCTISTPKLVHEGLQIFNQRYIPISVSYNKQYKTDDKTIHYLKFENENYCLINKVVDNKFPVLSNVKIEQGNYTFRFDAKAVAKLISGLKGKDKKGRILFEKKDGKWDVVLLEDYTNDKARNLGSVEVNEENGEKKIGESYVSIARINPERQDYKGVVFNAFYLSTLMKQKPDNQHYFYLTANTEKSDVFFSNIEDVVEESKPAPKPEVQKPVEAAPKPEKPNPQPKPEPKPSTKQNTTKPSSEYTKKDLQDAIKALEILSKKGNKFAGEALRGLMTLLKTT